MDSILFLMSRNRHCLCPKILLLKTDSSINSFSDSWTPSLQEIDISLFIVVFKFLDILTDERAVNNSFPVQQESLLRIELAANRDPLYGNQLQIVKTCYLHLIAAAHSFCDAQKQFIHSLFRKDFLCFYALKGQWLNALSIVSHHILYRLKDFFILMSAYTIFWNLTGLFDQFQK